VKEVVGCQLAGVFSVQRTEEVLGSWFEKMEQKSTKVAKRCSRVLCRCKAMRGKLIESAGRVKREKCEKIVAQLAHKKNIVAAKRLTSTVLVCHLAHKLGELAHKQSGGEGRKG